MTNLQMILAIFYVFVLISESSLSLIRKDNVNPYDIKGFLEIMFKEKIILLIETLQYLMGVASFPKDDIIECARYSFDLVAV